MDTAALLKTWALRFRRTAAYTAAGLVLGIVVLVLVPFPGAQLHPPASTMLLDRHGRLLRAQLTTDEMWRMPVTIDEVSPYMKQAALAYEDRHFFYHPGINPIAVARAAWANLRAGRIVQGGSTLTMQVARLMDPKPRTWRSKAEEAFRALQLELRYSKEEILAFYFNLAPYGGNLMGVGAAARFYFGKPPAQLSLGEAALLAALPNDPNRRRPDRHPEASSHARSRVLALLEDQHYISAAHAREAAAEPVPTARQALPFEAPHVAAWLGRRMPDAGPVVSELDGRVQETVEQLLRNHLNPLRARGITQGAVVVIDNQTRGVRALVGAYDFHEQGQEGQVNGAFAPRSPGSTLKPFVYALGLQAGLVSTEQVIEDVPVDYAGYRPVNYDESYRGGVTVREALIQSLNVPAVNMDAALGEGGLYTFLKEAGVTTLNKPRHHYGLTLVLGGGEVTLLELTALYAGLANGGRFAPARFLQATPERAGVRLLDAGTAYLITETLSQVSRPNLPAVWAWSVHAPKIAWKTGTSYGHRDAWSIGYTPRYSVGVWMGNFDGTGTPELVGVDVSAPLLLEVFEALEHEGTQRWFSPPRAVQTRTVCALSGKGATPHCAATREEDFVPGVAPNRPCDVHRLVMVDAQTGHRLCPHCRTGRSYTETVYEHWPAAMAQWRAAWGYPVDEIPAHWPGCVKVMAGQAPDIRMPADGSRFKIRAGVPLAYQKIRLEASVTNQTQVVYWFRGKTLIHTGAPGERVFWTPEVGTHRLVCMDDEGRFAEVTILVE